MSKTETNRKSIASWRRVAGIHVPTIGAKSATRNVAGQYHLLECFWLQDLSPLEAAFVQHHLGKVEDIGRSAEQTRMSGNTIQLPGPGVVDDAPQYRFLFLFRGSDEVRFR